MRDRLSVPLGENEDRVAIVRADGWSYAPRVAFGLAWTLLPWWLFFPFLRMGTAGFVAVGILAVGGLVYLANVRARWFGTAWVVTNERVFDVVKRGIGRSETMAFTWSEIVDIKATTRFPLGSVRLVLRNGPFDVAMPGLRDPMAVKKMLHEVQYVHRTQKAGRKQRV